MNAEDVDCLADIPRFKSDDRYFARDDPTGHALHHYRDLGKERDESDGDRDLDLEELRKRVRESISRLGDSLETEASNGDCDREQGGPQPKTSRVIPEKGSHAFVPSGGDEDA